MKSGIYAVARNNHDNNYPKFKPIDQKLNDLYNFYIS